MPAYRHLSCCNGFSEVKGNALVLIQCIFISRRAEGLGGEILKCPRLTVTFSFSHCNLKTHCCIFSKLYRYMHHVMGVCCIVNYNVKLNGKWFPQIVDRDYILYSLVLIFDPVGGGLQFFLEKQFFLISCFLHVLYYFRHF